VRLDWILVSEELAFDTYDTLPDRLSDHLGVVATVTGGPAAGRTRAPLLETHPAPASPGVLAGQ